MSDYKAPVPIPVGFQFPTSRPTRWYYGGFAIVVVLAVYLMNR
jgi:hypothetical protein